MFIDYPGHRRWMGFTLAVAAFAVGVHLGTMPPAADPLPLLVAGIGLLALTFFLIPLLRRVFPSPYITPASGQPLAREHQRFRLLAYLGFGAGCFLLGYPVGTLWVTPTGPTASHLVGMWFGILGSLCMIFAGLLSGLRRVPSWWWIGSRQWWLKGHLWLGLLSGLLILLHSNFRLGGLLEQTLMAVLFLVLGSGVFGLALQHVLPRLLTVRGTSEVPYEQIPHRCLWLRTAADVLVDTLCGPVVPEGALSAQKGDPKIDPASRAALRLNYETVIRPFLDPRPVGTSPLARADQARRVFADLRSLPGLTPVAHDLDKLEGYCAERRLLSDQEQYHHWLHVWLLAHIPLSALLLGLGIAHVVTALYY